MEALVRVLAIEFARYAERMEEAMSRETLSRVMPGYAAALAPASRWYTTCHRL